MKILVVDDERNIREIVSMVFEKDGHEVFKASTSEEAIEYLDSEIFDVVISDIKLPGINGIELLKIIKDKSGDIPVILITAYASTSSAIEALKNGAEDYIIKPFDIDELRIIVKKAYERKKLFVENLKLKKELEKQKSFHGIISQNKKMKEIFLLVEKIARTDSHVLITGESGTGKDMIARAIHERSEREGNFISINCSAIPETLLESELFGHKKGAFTGAVEDKEGLFESAHKGTLFLDEIGEMPYPLQAKLLRVIQEKKIRRIGSTKEIKVDVRIISATNYDIERLVKEGRFREDLFYRLNVIRINLPPLRERLEDIPILVEYFVEKFSKKFEKQIKGISPDVFSIFFKYPWPGNVRELENTIEKMVLLEEDKILTLKYVPEEIKRKAESSMNEDLVFEIGFEKYFEEKAKEMILKALEKAKGNKKRASEILKLSYRSFRYYYDKLVKGDKDGSKI